MTSMTIRKIALVALAAAGALAPPARLEAQERLRVYVGTYTRNTKSEGIYLLELDLGTGALAPRGLVAKADNPSFLAVHPTRRYLYAVNEVDNFGGRKAGGVSAFAVAADTGALALLNRQSSVGDGPCHLVVDRDGRNVLVANYGGGSVACLPIDEDGRLGERASFVQHKGKSVHPRRQGEPHAHSINLDPAGRFAFAADLGLDRVLAYRFDPARGRLAPNDPPAAAVAPGSGPRHFAFHPSGNYAYVINELTSTITVFAYDPEAGALKELQTISTLPEGYRGNTSTAEVQVHPSGKFVYGSNRGHDSIAVFAVDPESGRLAARGHLSGIRTPRNFAVDPTGRYLVAAHQAADKVEVFRIDPRTGALAAAGSAVEVPAPVCVKMVPLRP